MLVSHSAVKSSSEAQNSPTLKQRPVWMPPEKGPDYLSLSVHNKDFYLVSGILKLKVQSEKRKKEKALMYNCPASSQRESTNHQFISSFVQTQPGYSVNVLKKDKGQFNFSFFSFFFSKNKNPHFFHKPIDSQLLPRTDFSFLKFRPVYRARQSPSLEVRPCPLPIEPYGRFVFANGDKYGKQLSNILQTINFSMNSFFSQRVSMRLIQPEVHSSTDWGNMSKQMDQSLWGIGLLVNCPV
jgi:hypothetical protein